jgi:CheY-like chemotaxis protein
MGCVAPQSLKDTVVLVVEDDQDNRELVQAFLESHGATVRTAGSLAAAKEAFAERLPDVVLTDMRFPDGDGFELLRALRAQEGAESLPVIAVTGRAELSARERAVEAGFTKYVTKPFDVFALIAAVASAAALKRQAPAAATLETTEAAVERLIAANDVRGVLELLNGHSAYHYSSIFRFADGKLDSVWTFDRAARRVDASAPDLPIAASYCTYVASAAAAFHVADAPTDPRVADHSKRQSVRSYCGVPLFRADGSLFGTLCHYDEEPRPLEPAVIAELERVAEKLTAVLPPANARLPAST